jgi:acetyl esterase/lipase
MYHEGFEWVDFFVSQDIAAIVLLYRLPHGHHSVPSEDVYEAIRQAQAHAGEWHLSPSQIGIMGSSAGGHLASTIATHAPSSLRPSFQILLYPVISTDSAFTHHWSCRNLMGEHPSAELVRHYSNEHQVDASTPPAFIAASADDGDVPVLNSARYYEALVSHGVSANIHVYPSGGHGWGIKSSFKYHSQLLQSLRDWLESTKESSHDH